MIMSKTDQSTDSSDEDVYFGEYSLQEAKRDWKKYLGKKVNRRHTSICKLQELEVETLREVPIMANQSEEKFSLSSNPSEYLTPDESMSTEKSSQNSEFLEKLNQVINEPSYEASSYNTAFDETNENRKKQCEDTFLERIKDQTTFALDNVHHTLVENTVISSEESLNKVHSCENQNEENCCSEGMINSSIITISDESAYEFITNEDLHVSKSPDMSNGGSRCEELLSEAINDEDFRSSNEVAIKSEIMDTNSLYQGHTYLESENQEYCFSDKKARRKYSTFGFKNLNVSDSDEEPKEYSCHINIQDTSDSSSNEQDSSEEASFNLNVPSPTQKYERIIVDCNQLSKISEKTEFTTCIEDNSRVKQKKETSRASTPDNLPYSEIRNNSDTERQHDSETKRATTGIQSNSSSEVSKASSISGVSQLSKNSEVFEHLQTSVSSEATQSLSEFSPVQVPTIELDQFDDSCQFDDTLEEINRLLAQGVDYVMPETTPSKGTPQKELINSDNIISGSFMNTSYNNAGLISRTPTIKSSSSNSLEKCKKFYSADRIIKPLAEIKVSTASSKFRCQHESKIKPPSISAKKLFTKTSENLKPENAFKVPSKPVKKLPTPSKLSNPSLKNVVSPVGVYINHSPKYHPMIKVPQNIGLPCTRNPSKLIRTTSVKENIPCASSQEIPLVIYKPAKNKITKEENEIILPESIKKLVRKPVVTKHEWRIEADQCDQSIERRLMESDLTINLSHSNQDISVLTNKQALNIKKL